MSWDISKTIEFCYGHRVWSQELNETLALTNKCKCRHLHGHEAKVIVHFANDGLNNGMVTDFNHLNWLKKWIDDVIDHKFIIDINDPHFYQITGSNDHPNWRIMHSNYSVFDTRHEGRREIMQSFVIVTFVPTSENLAKWIYDKVEAEMPGMVSSVEWHETPKSKAVYNGGALNVRVNG